MKKILTSIMVVLLAVCSAPMVYAQVKYWDGSANTTFAGSGTEADPYLISTAEQLAGLAVRTNVDKEDFASKYLKLTADIYLTDFTEQDTTKWQQWEPIARILWQYGVAPDTASFRGHFNGDGHTIYNLYYGGGIDWSDDFDPDDLDAEISDLDFSVMNKALFANLDGGTVENVRLANAKMAGVYQALLVVKAHKGSTIRNCHVSGEIRSTETAFGGLVRHNAGLVENCSAEIHSSLQGGGAFVQHNEGIIRNCTTTGTMNCTKNHGAGFVETNNGLIEKCTANVNVQARFGKAANNTYWYWSGAGFAVYNEDGGVIRECAALGNVEGEGTSINHIWRTAIAGFCYRNWGGRIESSYCTGGLRNIGTDPTIATFCYNNGYDAQHSTDAMARGDVLNCYSTSSIQYTNADSYKNNIHAFIGSYHSNDGFNAELVEPSQTIGYFNQNGLPSITGQAEAVWGGIGKPLTQMQTQAFVDTLNMIASFLGLSQWELRDGLPRPTGVYQTNTAALLGGGEGTKASPYIIASKQHLENLRWLVSLGFAFKGKYFLQTADIALNPPFEQWEEEMPQLWKPIGSPRSNSYYSTTLTNEFNGVYDGGFHEVQNMYINSQESSNQGLFGIVGRGTVFRNLGVTDAYIRANGTVGILAGSLSDNCTIAQCWTTGDVSWKTQYGAAIGGMVGYAPAQCRFLNNSSSAKLQGGIGGNTTQPYTDAIKGNISVWAADTLINYLFTGNVNNGESGGYGSFQHKENGFVDKTKAKIEHQSDGMGGTTMPTEWIQSKELVNIYNYSVARWNTSHAGNDALQLNYWEWQEGDYPRVAREATWKPSVAITFISNGGEAVTTKYIYPNSEALPPQRPLREGYIFAGWYKDAALTQFFDWTTERPTSDITLYARWHEDKRWDIDITPFQNEFAKTYHIKTAAQLRGLAAIVNGLYDWGETIPFSEHDTRPAYGLPVSQTIVPNSLKGKRVVLDNDIVLCDTTDWQYWGRGAFGLPWKAIGSPYGLTHTGYNENPNLSFAGTFDGQGHVVYGIYEERMGMPYVDVVGGLFGNVADSAVIRNVGVEASVIDGQDYSTRGQKNDAVWYWRRSGYEEPPMNRLGLLAGKAISFELIEQCYAVGNMYSNDGYYSGLIGQTGDLWNEQQEAVRNCFARVNIYNKSIVQGYYTWGGLLYATPNTDNYGLTTLEGNATVSNCYSAGKTYRGFSGTNSYYNKELVSQPFGSATPVSTNEMHAKRTYKDWDFTTIWGRNDTINDGYPYLRVFNENAPADSEDPIIVTGIEITPKDTIILAGTHIPIHVNVLPENAPNRNYSFTFSPNDIEWAMLDEDKNFTTTLLRNNTLQQQSFTFAATTEEGGHTAQLSVSVWQTTLSITRSEYAYYVDNDYTFYACFSPVDLTPNDIVWTSSNPQVATIAGGGLAQTNRDYVLSTQPNNYYTGPANAIAGVVHCVGEGTTTITATALNGQIIATENITVSVVNIEPTSISIDDGWWIYLGIGDTKQLTATILPENATNKTVVWTSNNQAVATIDQSGMVKAIGEGTAQITATTSNGLSAYTNVVVTTIEPTDIVINEFTGSYIHLNEGETYQLTATVLPENANDKMVTWESYDPSVATISDNGLVTAVHGSEWGELATIIARTSNYIETSAIFEVTHKTSTQVTNHTNDSPSAPQKIFEDGKIYIILPDGRRYDSTGQQVSAE